MKSQFCCVSAMYTSFRNRSHQIYPYTIDHLCFCLPSKWFKDSSISFFHSSELLQTNLHLAHTQGGKTNKQTNPNQNQPHHTGVVLDKHGSYFLYTENMLLNTKSSLFQIKYSKAHPNKLQNAVPCSANTRAKSGSYNCSCPFSSGWVKWEDSWLGTLLGYAY